MAIDIQIPEFSESISEGTIGSWIKNIGDKVSEGETIVEVETDKVVLEIPAPASGVITQILKNENDIVNSLEVIGQLDAAQSDTKESIDKSSPENNAEEYNEDDNNKSNNQTNTVSAVTATQSDLKKTSPAVRKLMQEENIALDQVTPTGKNNRVTLKDVKAAISTAVPAPVTALKESDPQSAQANKVERVPMTSLRKRISDRLVNAQQEYAMLTTFNEVNMQAIMQIRSANQEAFMEKHATKLGFMSFFVLAAVEALKAYPIVNASVEGDDIIYHQYIDVGVAVSTERGLVVPIVRGADVKSLSAIEIEINSMAEKARENKLSIDELIGGTFTITNGGVFGSMLSTPIVNPPQSAILGMHAIEKRPIVIDDEVKIAPMMYLALSYDHRIIDGREAVLFLSQIKKIIENPIQLLLHL